MSYDPKLHAFIDTETTGLDPVKHSIWEIAVIVDGEEHVWQQVVYDRARRSADPVALEINGFNDRYDGATALSGADSTQRFAALVAGRHLVGSNPAFDAQRIAAGLRQWWGIDPRWHYRMRDINSMMHGFLQHGVAYHHYEPKPPFSTTAMAAAIGVDPAYFEPQHTALADARFARSVYETIVGPPKDTP